MYQVKPAKHKLFLTYLSTMLMHYSIGVFLGSWHGTCVNYAVSCCYSTTYAGRAAVSA